MMPDGIKEKFEFYRKWFQTLIVKEFMNLPSKYQEQFLVISKEFIVKCEKIHGENRSIKEKVINILITDILPPDNKKETYIICGKSSELKDEVRMSMPITKQKPQVGAKLYHTVFSVDGVVWYSSKEDLITKGDF